MDPRQHASAPPVDYRGGEKSYMGQMPPPSYHDTTSPGYHQPGYNPLQPQGFGPPPPYGGEVYTAQTYPVGFQQQGPTTIIQPTVYVTRAPLANPVNDYLGYSIFTLLCCCLPLGITALIYSMSAREANHAGDQALAMRSSRTARTINHTALGIGVFFFVLTLVWFGVLATRS